jgi:cleavage stimulation factor subunit 3
MAEYDPTSATDYATPLELENGDEPQLDHEAEDEDDDYDPSLGFGDDDAAEVTQTPEAPAQAKVEIQSVVQAKPRTKAGFEMDDDDAREMEDTQESAAAPQSHVNDTEGAQISESAASATGAQEIPLASEPSQEDTAAVLSATAQQSAPLNGSSSLVVPTSVSDDASNPAPVEAQSHTPQDSVSPVSAPVIQSSSVEEGKHQAQAVPSATISAAQSATATPQPTNAAIAPPAQPTESVPQTPTTQRLPHDKVGQLEDRIKEDPKADTDAWRSLIQHYREKGQLDNARKVYERFLEVFPTSVCTSVLFTLHVVVSFFDLLNAYSRHLKFKGQLQPTFKANGF